MAASSGGIKAGKAFVEIFTKDSATKSLRAIAARFKAFGAGISAVGAGMLAASTAVAAPLAAAVKTFTDWGSTLHDASQRTGVSAQALAELGHAAEQSGASFSVMEKGVQKMKRTIFDAATGGKEASETLAMLGTSAEELKGLSPDEQFMKLGDAISRLNAGQQSPMMEKIFGRGGKELLPMLADGAAGIAAMRQEFRDLGGSISDEAAAKADALGDKLGGLWAQVKIGAFSIGEALAPTLIDLVSGILRAGAAVVKFVQDNQELIRTVAKVVAIVAAVGTGLIVAGGIIAGIGFAISGFLALLSAVGAAFGAIVAAVMFLLSPLGIMIALAVTLAGVLLQVSGAWDAIKAILKSVKDTAVEAFGGIKDALAAGDFKLAAQILWLGLKLEWAKGIQPLIRIFNSLKNRIFGIFDSLTTGLKRLWIQFLEFLHIKDARDLLALDQEFQARERARDAANLKALNDSRAAVDAAQKRFTAAVAEAKAAAAGFGADGPQTVPELPNRQEVNAALDVGADSSKGAFLASAAALLGRSGEAIEQKILDAIEDGNEDLAAIRREVGWKFA